LVFRLLFSFCNLIFAFSFCNVFWSDILSFASAKSGISTFLQLLQFGIYVLSLQLFWYFIFSSVSAIWYLHSVSAIFFGVIFCFPLLQNLVFRLSFSFCHDIYYQRDCLVTLVTYWYESFLFSSYYILCIVTTRVLFRLLTTWFFMSELSTLRSNVIISSMAPLLCLLFLLSCRFLYQGAFHLSFLFSSWQTLDACNCRIVSLRGDVK
jgi:hypothetical protein